MWLALFLAAFVFIITYDPKSGILNKYIDENPANLREAKADIIQASEKVIKYLESSSIPVKDGMLSHVANISTNNDKFLGKLIAEAFNKVGKNGVVLMEESETNETHVDFVEGTQFDSGLKSPHLITDRDKGVAVLDNPYVLIISSPITNIRKIQSVLEHVIKQKRSLLIVANVEQQPTAALLANKVKGNIKVNIIDIPGFGNTKADTLDDLAMLTGATVINEELGDDLDLIDPQVLGEVTKAVTNNKNTILQVDVDQQTLEERIKDVKVLADAERSKEAIIIRAKAEAEEALVKDIEAAKAQEQAAEFKAKELETMANAELRIANQQAESKKILAQAQQVEAAAKGLAEADVIKAKAEANALQGEADAKVLRQKLEAEAQGNREVGLAQAQVQSAMAEANEKQGEVEAINLERKMQAEAKGLEEKLQALNSMNQDARDYESFTLQLNQQKELVLAKLSASKDIAEHQAHVMAKALGDADINIMGGDGQFFNQFMSAISLGKSIDGIVDESKTVQTIFKDHLNGDRNLIEDLKGVLAGANGSAETLKNYNMSKLLKQLSNTTAAEKSQLLSMLGNLGTKAELESKD